MKYFVSGVILNLGPYSPVCVSLSLSKKKKKMKFFVSNLYI